MKEPKREVSLLDLTFHDRAFAEKNANDRYARDVRRYEEEQAKARRNEKWAQQEAERKSRRDQEKQDKEERRLREEEERALHASSSPESASTAATTSSVPLDSEGGILVAKLMGAGLLFYLLFTPVGPFLGLGLVGYLLFTASGRSRLFAGVLNALMFGAAGAAIAGMGVWLGLWDAESVRSVLEGSAIFGGMVGTLTVLWPGKLPSITS